MIDSRAVSATRRRRRRPGRCGPPLRARREGSAPRRSHCHRRHGRRATSPSGQPASAWVGLGRRGRRRRRGVGLGHRWGRGRRGLAVCRQRDRPVAAAAALASRGPRGRPAAGRRTAGRRLHALGRGPERYRGDRESRTRRPRRGLRPVARSVRRGRRPRERTRQERPVRDVRPSNARVQRRRRQGEHRHGGEGACDGKGHQNLRPRKRQRGPRPERHVGQLLRMARPMSSARVMEMPIQATSMRARKRSAQEHRARAHGMARNRGDEIPGLGEMLRR